MPGIAKAATALVHECVTLPPPFTWAEPIAGRLCLMHDACCLAEAYFHEGALIFTVAKEYDQGRSFHRFNYADPDFPEQFQTVLSRVTSQHAASRGNSQPDMGQPQRT